MLCKVHCPKDGNGVMIAAAAVAVPAGGVVWLLTDTVFLPVCIAVLCVACVAGAAVVVWNVWRNGPMWRPGAVRAAERPAIAATQSPAAIPARAPAAITAPRIVAGVVLAREEVTHQL